MSIPIHVIGWVFAFLCRVIVKQNKQQEKEDLSMWIRLTFFVFLFDL